MSNNDKKPTNKFRLLSLQMKEIQKSQKPNQVATFRGSNSSESLSILEDMSAPSREHQTGDRDPNVPDRSYGDYFCPLCDSHMNSDGMWTAHITGKRHLKNVDKGSNETKYEELNEESCVKHEIRNVKDPIIGLSYIHEIRRKEIGVQPIFTCFLCQATFPTVILTIEHVVSVKHRMNFMKENSPDDYTLLESMDLKKDNLNSVVQEVAAKLEKKFGRGAVKVKQEKFKIAPTYTYPSKRLLEVDDEKEKKIKKYPKYEDVSPNRNYKANDHSQHSRKDFEKDKFVNDVDRRRHSSSEDEDSYRRRTSSRKKLSNKIHESSSSRDSHKDYFRCKKSVSPIRSSRPRFSPPHSSKEKSPYGCELPPRSGARQLSPPRSRATPLSPPRPSSSSQQSNDNSQALEKFAEFLNIFLRLPTEQFLMIACKKMDNMNLNSIKELKLLKTLVNKGNDLYNSVSPEHSIEQVSSSTVVSPNINRDSSLPQSQLPSQSSLSFVREFLEHSRSSSTITHPVVPTLGRSVGVPTLSTPSYASLTYGNPSQMLGSSHQTYGNEVQNTNSYQSNTSLQNHASSLHFNSSASSYQPGSYSNTPSSNPSVIPGLTLAEGSRERETYSYGFHPNPSYGY